MKPGSGTVDDATETCETAEGGEGFDQVLHQLESVVAQLEQSELPLEEALAAFEKGVGLSRRAQSILDAAERKVEVLMRDGETEPLDPADEQ
jgi:exodeoxyribonuclease VII small subunit